MASLSHSYYCTRCHRFLYGETLASIAAQVNAHMTAFHPAEFAKWDENGITHSANYSTHGALPEYLVPHGTTSHRVPVLPSITDADRAMLKAGYVKWD